MPHLDLVTALEDHTCNIRTQVAILPISHLQIIRIRKRPRRSQAQRAISRGMGRRYDTRFAGRCLGFGKRVSYLFTGVFRLMKGLGLERSFPTD